MSRAFNIVGSLIACLSLGITAIHAQAERPTWVTQDEISCADCHDRMNSDHRFGRDQLQDPEDCQKCHGPASGHVEEGDPDLIRTFDPELCASCHVKNPHVRNFSSSVHGQNGLTCLTCHVIHAKDVDSEVADQLLAQPIPTLCMECHEEPKPNHHPIPSQGSCIACHDPHANVEQEGSALTQKCLVCHSTNPHVGEYAWSAHAKGHVGCVECHGIHNERYDKAKDQCMSCHPVREIEVSHPQRHPGNLSCIECHNPHERQPYAFEDRYSPRCIVCHDDKGEPFAFSHEAGREQGCLECHETHRSTQPRLLKSTPRFLCISCHSDAHLRDSARRVRDCLDCHPSFHGSHEESRFIR